MNLFQEYQAIAHSKTLSQSDLERLAKIVEIASLDEKLLSAIMEFEYLSAQEEGLLSETNICQYLDDRDQLVQFAESTRTRKSANGVLSEIELESFI